MAAANFLRIVATSAVFTLGITALVVTNFDAPPPGVIPTSLAAQAHAGLLPLLPLPMANMDGAQLATLGRDPDVLKHKPEDATDAARLAEEIKEARTDLAHAQGPRALELNEQVYLGAAALAYYLEDVTAGRSPGNVQTAAAQLAETRALVLEHAHVVTALAFETYAASSTPATHKKHGAEVATNKIAGKAANKQQDKASFHSAATRFATSPSAAQATLKSLAEKSTDPATKKRAAVLVAVYQVEHGTSVARVEAATLLQSQINVLRGEKQVALRLELARNLAGLDKHGHKIAKPDAAYRAQLANALRHASAQSGSEREATVAYAVNVWRQAEAGKIDYAHPVLALAANSGTAAARAVTERAALNDWQAGNKAGALQKYGVLAQSLSGSTLRADIDLRILDLRRQDYVGSKDAKPYETALNQANKVYLDPGILGDGSEAKAKVVAAEIAQRHQVLVYNELARAQKPSADQGQRHHAITMANTFVATLTDAKAIEVVKAKVAALYAQTGAHREAVALYSELAATAGAANPREYLIMAIHSQGVLANWPALAPWQGFPTTKGNGKISTREDLLVLYKKLSETTGANADWATAAHMGLLSLSLGRAEDAFVLWQGWLKKAPSGSDAANAAGTMLIAYDKVNNYAALESLSRLCLEHKLGAVFHSKTVSARQTLAVALLGGGKEALAATQFAVAVAKLKEFVDGHSDAKAHDEGFYLLSTAYRGTGRHTDAIKTLLAFVDLYPRSGYYRQALLDGGDYAAPMAFEDNVMFFYNRFLGRFSNDGEAPRVRTALTELYLGRGRYADALGIYAQTLRAPGVDPTERFAALAAIMELEDRHGTAQRAGIAADALLRNAAAPEEFHADALALKARLAARAGRYAELQLISAQLTGLSSSAGQEALGETRYLLATMQSKHVAPPAYNLELRDPAGAVEQRYQAYKTVRAAYESVCAAGQTSYCAPAMLKLADVSGAFIKSVEEIAVQDTLAKEQVAKFHAYKISVMNDATVTAQRADSQSLAAVRAGNADPDWTQSVIWQNSADWNFDRVSGETGNGYVQWSVSDSAKGAE